MAFLLERGPITVYQAAHAGAADIGYAPQVKQEFGLALLDETLHEIAQLIGGFTGIKPSGNLYNPNRIDLSAYYFYGTSHHKIIARADTARTRRMVRISKELARIPGNFATQRDQPVPGE